MVDKEILSQSEIDMLISALASGSLTAEEVKKENKGQGGIRKYDFRRPNKFSKDQLRTLFMLHDNAARVLSNYLSAYLRTSFQFKIVSVEQLTYEDFVMSIPSPTLMTVFSMAPLKGNAIWENNPALVFPIIDLLFGGQGRMVAKVREFTDIELGVMQRVTSKIIENIAASWSDLFKFTPKIEAVETNPQFNQIISPTETVAIVTFSALIGKYEGMANLCLPYLTLEPVVSKLSAHYWFAHQEPEAGGARRAMQRQLMKLDLELKVLMGETSISVRELLQLQVGDVVPINTSMGGAIPLQVANETRFYAYPGVLGPRLAVQVSSLVKEEAFD